MNLKRVYRKITLLLVLAGIAAGCTMQPAPAQPMPVYPTTTPAPLPTRAPGELAPEVEATKNARESENLQSTIIAQAAQFTATAQSAQATRAAQTQAAVLQAQQFAGMTQTAVAMRAEQTALPVTETALAVALAREIATVEAAHATATQSAIDAEVAAIRLQETREQAERDKRQWDMNTNMWGMLQLVIVGAAVAIVGILVLAVNRFVAIKAYQAQNAASVHYLPDAGIMIVDGQPVALPGGAAALPARATPTPTREQRLSAAIKGRRDADDATLQRRRERREREAWKRAAWFLLKWGENTGSYSARHLSDTLCLFGTKEDAANFTNWLHDMGALEYRHANNPRSGYRRPLDEQGREMSAQAVMKQTVWATSFPYPTGDVPTIKEPDFTHDTTRQTDDRHNTDTKTRNTAQTGGNNTKIVGGRFYSSLNPPPMTWDELMEDAERKRRLQGDDDEEFEAG